jgi:hypothetical protein
MEAEEPTTPPSFQLNRDERLEIRLLRDLGWKYEAIRQCIGATIRQIQYTVKTQATPQRQTGRPPLLTPAQVEVLIDFVCASKKNRRMSYSQIPRALEWECSKYVIRNALQHAGFQQYHA